MQRNICAYKSSSVLRIGGLECAMCIKRNKKINAIRERFAKTDDDVSRTEFN